MMRFDFIGKKYLWFAFSGLIIVASIVSFFIQGINQGIEFTGGTIFDLSVKKEVVVEELRSSLSEIGAADAIIQPLGNDEVLIRSKSLSKEGQQEVVAKVEEVWGIKEIRYIQNVGPGWGKNISDAARLALIFSIAILLIYISWRFEYKMAIAAIIALIHDILITVGVYSLVGREVTPNTVAAVLTILGYSLYDTVVVFHRVKENTSRMQRETYSMMVNRSINQVLMRSINTSLLTLLPISGLLILGGETLKDFSFALLIGMISGAYSSIFIASPILAMWKEVEPRYRSIRAKLQSA